jgi:SAM-dependent methyltransferase
MKEDKSNEKYTDAVNLGHYDLYRGGLRGKYDNVRIYWEDQIRKIMLKSYLQALVDRKKKEGSKVRIVDLGAGSGEAFRLLTSLIRKEAGLQLHQARVLPYEMIDVYIGCDLNEDMVAQGNANYPDRSNVLFRQEDFSKGFPFKDEKPFDLYFCSYGSFSHIDTPAIEHLFTEMVEHVDKRALIVGDWLGRHSIEWPCYWKESIEKTLDYSMSWLPTKGKLKPKHFPMLFWLGDEIRSLVNHIARKTKTRIGILELYDCSLFVGRHVDTGEYNDWISPLRSAVNYLHEANVRTDLESLKVEVIPVPEYDELNSYFAKLQFCWNSLVVYCQRRLERRQHPVRIKNWRSFPPILQIAVMMLDRVIDAVSWMRMGDPRANIIEPQLGYALRSLEMELQEGAGRGHSLVGVFEVRKG